MTKTGSDQVKKAAHAEKMAASKADNEAVKVGAERQVLKELPVKADATLRSPQMKEWLKKNDVDLRADPEFRKKYEQMLNADVVLENSVRAANYIHELKVDGDAGAREAKLLKTASEKGLISTAVMEDELNSTTYGHEMNVSRKNYNDVLVSNIASRTKVEVDYEGNTYGTLGTGAVKNTNLVDREPDGRRVGNKKDLMKGADTGLGERGGSDNEARVGFVDDNGDRMKDDRVQKNVKSSVGQPSKKQGTGGKFTWDGGYRASRDVDGELNKWRASQVSERSEKSKGDKLSHMVVSRDVAELNRASGTKSETGLEVSNGRGNKGSANGKGAAYQYAYSDEVDQMINRNDYGMYDEELNKMLKGNSHYDLDYEDELHYNMYMQSRREAYDKQRRTYKDDPPSPKMMSRKDLQDNQQFPPLSRSASEGVTNGAGSTPNKKASTGSNGVGNGHGNGSNGLGAKMAAENAKMWQDKIKMDEDLILAGM